MTMYLAAKTKRWRQGSVAPMMESATTTALNEALRIQQRQVHILFDTTLLVRGIVFFRCCSHICFLPLSFRRQRIQPGAERAAANFLHDSLELTPIRPNSTALMAAIKRETLEGVSSSLPGHLGKLRGASTVLTFRS
jgi:hypothetical protein